MSTDDKIIETAFEKIGTEHPLSPITRADVRQWLDLLRPLIEPQPEIYIVQNDAGEVVGVFRDADEASAAYQYTDSDAEYSIIQETVTEPGEYAESRIAELTAEWERCTGETARDYALSEDDWIAGGLNDDEAAEIVRLIDWNHDNA